MKVRPRTPVYEAIQWDGESEPVGTRRIRSGRGDLSEPQYSLIVPTPEGQMFASRGDWLVMLPIGCIVVRNGTFQRRYEPVEEAACYPSAVGSQELVGPFAGEHGSETKA